MSRGKKLNQETRELVLATYKSGLTYKEVADKLGISFSVVGRIVRESGYDRYHVGSRLAKSLPNIPAPVEAKASPEPRKQPFTALSRAMKMRGDTTMFVYEISTESDVIHIEADSVLMDIKVDAIQPFIEELNGIKSMLGSPS